MGNFSKPPLKKGQFVLMDYRNDHLNEEQRKEPPTFLYAMDMGNGKYFLEETSLGLVNPLTMENLKERLEKRLSYRNISCLLYTSPSPRDIPLSRMPSSA